MRRLSKESLALLVAGLTFACGILSPSAETSPTSTVAVSTSQPTPLVIPPSPSASPAPQRLDPSGPYLLLEGDEGIWIANPDGTFVTRLSDQGVGSADMHRALSPDGRRLAFIALGEKGPELRVLDLPTGHRAATLLLQPLTLDQIGANTLSPQAFAYYALTEYDNVAWQPGQGQLIAFIGVLKGPTADLYTYDLLADKVSQLTSGASQAVFPTWSPDGQYVLHFGGSWVPPFGGAILGYNRTDGAWAVRVSDGKIITQPTPLGDHRNFVAWQDATHYLMVDRTDSCLDQNLQSVDAATGEAATILPDCLYSQPVRSPVNGALILSSKAGCDGCSLGAGLFLLPPGESTPRKLGDVPAIELSWLPESQVFDAYPLALYSSDGQQRYDPPLPDKSFKPAVSKAGFQAWEVIENQQGRVEVKAPGDVFRTILQSQVAAMAWDPIVGETLVIAAMDGKLYAATAPDFVPREVGNLGGRVSQMIWAP